MNTARWIGAAVVLEFGLGIGAAVLLQPPAPITVGQAVSAFRAHSATAKITTHHPIRTIAESSEVPTGTTAVRTPSATSAKEVVPVAGTAPVALGLVTAQPGVYVYDTTGQEQVDQPNKTTHTYPHSTTVTASGSPCDASLLWQPIEGRSLEITGCYDHGAFRVTGMSTTQTFFGYRTRAVYTCPGKNIAMPAAPKADTSWHFACDSARSHAAIAVTVIGTEARTVENTTLQTWHVRFDTNLTGATRGTENYDFWFSSRDALPIAINSATDVMQDTSFGSVHYVESFALALAQLHPHT